MIDLDELKQLALDASAGPWCTHPNGTSVWQGESYDSEGTGNQGLVAQVTVDKRGVTNAAFIAAASPSVVLALLQLVAAPTGLRSVADSKQLLEVARRAIEDALVELRDSRISIGIRNNGLVIREQDGTESPIIRFGPEDAVRIGLMAIADSLSVATVPKAAARDPMDLVICGTYGCQNLKQRLAAFCGPCGAEYLEDPEAFK